MDSPRLLPDAMADFPLLINAVDVRDLQQLTPAAPILLAGLLCAVLPVRFLRKLLMLAAPLGALALWMGAPFGNYGAIEIAGLDLTTFRYDGLSRVFGLVFIVAAFLNSVYGLHARSRIEDAAALVYAGSGIGAVFAGDLVTLFVFWEISVVASAILILGGGRPGSIGAGLRYLAVHVASGMLLLAGMAAVYAQTGSIAFGALDPGSAGGLLVLLSFGIKAAFPLLHTWLPDSYPRASAVGAVVLSAFTTKMAVYALARGFAGYEPLIYVGAVMTVFPVFFAVVENDLRRVLSYSLNNQVGFMVCGVGLASAGAAGAGLALAGVAAHAFAHVIYKALLFMSMGAVLHRVGTTRAGELGGLARSMPFTALFCIVGAASISAIPLFSGFVSKSMILAAAAEQGRWLVWLMLLFASAGVLEHSGIKIPFFAFFAHDRGLRPREAPANMLWAMFTAAVICIYIGLRPDVLYGLLPVETGFRPYTVDHVVAQCQLALGAAFAFALLYRTGLYPRERAGTILDVDWVWRRLGGRLVLALGAGARRVWAGAQAGAGAAAAALGRRLHDALAPAGALSKAVPAGALAVWTVLILGLAIVVTSLARS